MGNSDKDMYVHNTTGERKKEEEAPKIIHCLLCYCGVFSVHGIFQMLSGGIYSKSLSQETGKCLLHLHLAARVHFYATHPRLRTAHKSVSDSFGSFSGHNSDIVRTLKFQKDLN